jgi:hypothetical protein
MEHEAIEHNMEEEVEEHEDTMSLTNLELCF